MILILTKLYWINDAWAEKSHVGLAIILEHEFICTTQS